MGVFRPTAIDLFSGCGGLTRGFTDAGVRVVQAVEADGSAAATFKVNFPDCDVRRGEIRYYRDVPEVDLVIGGPPCQGFSQLGKNDPDDARNRLWRSFVRVVLKSRCRAFVLENVDRFGDSPEVRSLVRWTRPGRPLQGFQIERYTLNAADFGVPQRRVRTFVIGTRLGAVGAPEPTHQKAPRGSLSPWVGLWDSIAELDWDVVDTDLPDATIEVLGSEVPGAFKLGDIHVGRSYQPLSLRRFRYIPAGGNRHCLPDHLLTECWRRHTTGAADVLGRLEWDRPSVTIRTEFFKPEKGRYLHPEADRALTHAEAALIQGFDERHLWCGSKSEIARQIGNAVPPPLAQAVARRVVRVFRRR